MQSAKIQYNKQNENARKLQTEQCKKWKIQVLYLITSVQGIRTYILQHLPFLLKGGTQIHWGHIYLSFLFMGNGWGGGTMYKIRNSRNTNVLKIIVDGM